MYIHGRSLAYVIVDECLHEVESVDAALRILAEKVEKRRKFSIDETASLFPKFAMEVNKRPPEPNDWRRKSKRSFNGYQRHV
ncbi:hypothetical protein HOU35_gp089 [Acinetobacter phage vB_AbaM_B09_Aci05]|uniref:Uncharacterized protein n=1 Tax=Acinetobacter phage vB_AbaM_B09_Aci05 TaxID=2315458 RepID=A0A386KBH3_9CAUD|nr:hypothetical protein HOU35_gp089 [Acinetobacter phage vB_AbaM_B09_Aci05]AYD82429.1 hypothetical protein Aci05_088 [Acinetobacter phage vB_AbaM_B09_Aci05]QMP19074.1 hypothetical protein FKOIJHOC_00126 [Acinetobacter phage Ab_121]